MNTAPVRRESRCDKGTDGVILVQVLVTDTRAASCRRTQRKKKVVYQSIYPKHEVQVVAHRE